MMVFAFMMGAIMTLVIYTAYILLFAFTFWMAIDAGKQDRFWWVALIIGLPVVGPAVYYFTEKKHEYAKAEPHHIHTSETEEQHEMTPHRHAEKHAHEEKKGETHVEEKTA